VSRGGVTVAFEPTQEIAVIRFEIKEDDAEASQGITFVLPCSPMAPLVGKSVDAPAKSPAKDMASVLREHLYAIPVTVSVRLASVALRFDEALDINQGDILLLDKNTDEAIDLIVDNRTILRGRPAKSDGRYAVCVTERVAEPVGEPPKRPAAK
jgi:flagellar motor switch protein FliM